MKKEILKIISRDYYKRCFIPHKKERRKRQGVWREIERPLFPGYLFLETEQVENMSLHLKKLMQFGKLLKTGDYFAPVEADEEAFIRELLGDGESVEVSYGIIENQTVLVTSGPLQGLEGYIRRIDRHKRKAYLQVEMFDRTLEISVGLEIVKKI